ncbi:MAG TPA: 3-phosphoshikimate 1-carboxyvinyltransferase [Gemmatimonadaceae bacterium]|nr:3-phosphoshikimate 1-carboxyvinyltransferase [Gemmatimonadaceae bacterium]
MAALKVAGTVRVPGDKSISHRALILGALANGRSQVRGILDSEDVRSTAGVLRALGAPIGDIAGDMRIEGVGLRGLRQPQQSLDCGNSGTTTRLMAGVAAAHPFASRFEGDASLSRRPMKRIAEPLSSMGARFEFASGDGLPMTIHGADLRSIDWDTRAASAQVKSAIILGGLVAGVEVRVTEKSPSRDHTERMLRAMGVDIENDGKQVCLRPAKRLAAMQIDVPGDPSSAAFFVALAALASGGSLLLTDVLLNPTRTGFIEAMKRMGARIDLLDTTETGGEATGKLRVLPSELQSVSVGADEVPSLIDELPLLACTAAAAGIDLEITGAEELRVKESDRIATVVHNLRGVGAEVEELPDGLRVIGGRRNLEGAIDPRGDHRIAMAFGILSAASGNRIKVMNPECVAVSYPGFWNDLRRVTA